ncbi:MAG: MFS transporter [Actinomycetota bacterium]|nr:MFS transporter [Actinomycetota bacterium]
MAARRRWTILAVGTLAQAAACAFVYGIPMLLPAFNNAGAGLFSASLLVDAPTIGLLLALYAWGAVADRRGERLVIAIGVAAAAVALVAAAAVPTLWLTGVLLGIAGAGGASAFSASGRLVMGWFPTTERGLAMGTRQTAQPVGVAIAALVLPPVAHHGGIGGALLVLATMCAAAAVAVFLLASDPPRPVSEQAAPVSSPYRGSRTLLRIHAASSLLVVPQMAMSVFTLVYLVGQRGWDPSAAGRLIFVFQFVGAAGRVGCGIWTDRVGSRLRPMRQLAVMSAVLMACLALGAATHAGWIVLVFGLSAVVTVADNGMAFTSVAEFAGRDWSGRALGAHNTVQNLAAVATPPVLATVIGQASYGLAFALVAVPPLVAILVTPVTAEKLQVTGASSGSPNP